MPHHTRSECQANARALAVEREQFADLRATVPAAFAQYDRGYEAVVSNDIALGRTQDCQWVFLYFGPEKVMAFNAENEVVGRQVFHGASKIAVRFKTVRHIPPRQVHAEQEISQNGTSGISHGLFHVFRVFPKFLSACLKYTQHAGHKYKVIFHRLLNGHISRLLIS